MGQALFNKHLSSFLNLKIIKVKVKVKVKEIIAYLRLALNSSARVPTSPGTLGA